MFKNAINKAMVLAVVLSVFAVPAMAVEVTVTIENLAPASGNFLTPVWVGFHNGMFDIYDIGAPSTPGLERIAEDGNTGPISGEFLGSGAGTVDATIPGPNGPIAPGDTATMTFDLDPNSSQSRFFSYARMIIPSNDAFVANAAGNAHQVFDELGNFVGGSFVLYGDRVRDAGTEVNDEVPANTAFFGQMAPNTGLDENSTVQIHDGFLPVGSGGILDSDMFSGADFTQDGYRIARITLSVVEAGTETLDLTGDRFRVSINWNTADANGTGLGNELTGDTGYFYFFSPNNVEVVVKVLDACDISDRFWVFAGGLTDVGVELTVEDLQSGEVQTYNNTLGTPFAPITDTDAFATCP
ncbi:MAG: spondin domain-containing protein [Acidobacteriota bacterium]